MTTQQRTDPTGTAAEATSSEVITVVTAPAATVFGTDSPIQIVERTATLANVLKDAIRKGGMISQIQGRDYVLMEGWSYLGAMLGISPQTRSTEPLRRDSESPVVGFTATVELVTKAGDTVGGATAICTRDESNWSDRDDYALMSMAQTRAAAKAFRMTFGFVMKAAGYEATPAEEMPEQQTDEGRDDRQRRELISRVVPGIEKTPSNDDLMIEQLSEEMNELALERKDMADVLGVDRVTRPAILRYLHAHDDDTTALIEAVKESVAERIAEGGDV